MKFYAHYEMGDKEPEIVKSDKPWNEVKKDQEFLMGPKDTEFELWIELLRFYHNHYLSNRDVESKTHVKKIAEKLVKADMEPPVNLAQNKHYKTA